MIDWPAVSTEFAASPAIVGVVAATFVSATSGCWSTGTVAVVELVVHEDWVGHRITDLEDATGARVAFMIRFGSGLLPEPKTVIQAGDQVYVAAIAGRAAEAQAIAAQPPSEDFE